MHVDHRPVGNPDCLGATPIDARENTSHPVGVAEIVRVIHGDVTDVELPERVDVIVSEWLGGFGIDEGMLGSKLSLRLPGAGPFDG